MISLFLEVLAIYLEYVTGTRNSIILKLIYIDVLRALILLITI